jgi:hypothetical protein
VETAKAMLSNSGLPTSLWGEAICTAAYIRNRTPSRTLASDSKLVTPWQLWHGISELPDLSNLHVFGHTEMVKLLLGQQNSSPGPEVSTPLDLAIEYGHVETVKELLKSGSSFPDGSLRDALEYAAAARGHFELVHPLVDDGADVNCKLHTYGSALEAASLNGHKNVVVQLLDLGADVDGRYGGKHGHPLHAAVYSGF